MGLARIRNVYETMSITGRSTSVKSKKIVVVSGTNGKGSTVALIEAGLLSMGATVGTYTSPHIRKYNERVKINGKPVSDDRLVKAFEEVERARAGVALTYFEFGTLAALDILFASDLDVVILEIGLGGRLDAVNIVDADLSIITSVALDHIDWLGDSLDVIGFEKAGILRENRCAILGENLPSTVSEHAESLSCKTLTVGKDLERNEQGILLKSKSGSVAYSGFPAIRLPENNILIAFQALKRLSDDMSPQRELTFNYELLVDCFTKLKIEGRLEEQFHEKLSSRHRVFLDVGHNPHAAKYLLGVLTGLKTTGVRVNAVYSSLADKDVKSLVKILSPVVDDWFLAPLKDSRALNAAELESAVGEFTKNMLLFESLYEALQSALTLCSDSANLKTESITLVFGSFFVIEAAKAYFEDL